MSNPSRIPPPDVQAAAKIVDGWLKSVESQQPRRNLEREWAQKLDRAREG